MKLLSVRIEDCLLCRFIASRHPLLFPISTKRHKHLCVISSSYHFLLELAQNGNYLILLLLALRAPRGDKKVEGRGASKEDAMTSG
jgi:hypothetical protein